MLQFLRRDLSSSNIEKLIILNTVKILLVAYDKSYTL